MNKKDRVEYFSLGLFDFTMAGETDFCRFG